MSFLEEVVVYKNEFQKLKITFGFDMSEQVGEFYIFKCTNDIRTFEAKYTNIDVINKFLLRAFVFEKIIKKSKPNIVFGRSYDKNIVTLT